MKVLYIAAALNLFAVYSFGLRCWECNNAPTNDICLNTGRIVACVEEEAICEDQIRHMQYGRQTVIEKRCKQARACHTNVDQNLRPAYPIQCAVGQNSPTSVCRCCCDRNGCNRDLLTCWRGYPTPPPLPQTARPCSNFPIPPANGEMQCTGNKEPGTYCDFKCHQNFYLEGEVRLTCLENSRWDHEEPVCQEQTCSPESFFVGNGSVTCTNRNKLRSRCTFKCDPDFRLIGNSIADCQPGNSNSKRGIWTASAPTCKPLVCPMQGPIRHGSFSCSRGNKFMSTCTWRCGGQFQIFPSGFDTNVCLESGEWSRPWPCCTLPCPPFAVVDLMIVLDSSSSVGLANWLLMTNFVAMLFDHFALQPDAAAFSVFRYNGRVDETTAIFFNDFPNNKPGFLRRFREIPYDGSGTETGRALTYAARTALSRGNREEAPDIVILITDGNSQDRVRIPGRTLRSTGADVRVIPVRPPDNSTIDLEEMEDIAGSPENVITVAIERGFAALDEEFAVNLAAGLCPPPCSNPFHDHGRTTPDRLLPFIEATDLNG